MKSLRLAATLGGFLVMGARAGATTFYVSPNGDDSNDGSLSAPFATITRARDVIRTLQPLSAPVDVYLRGGIYASTSPIVFSPQDSGSPSTPITYAAYPGETPVLSSSRTINGWTPYSRGLPAPGVCPAPGHMWSASVPASWRFNTLFLDGVRQDRSALPNSLDWENQWYQANTAPGPNNSQVDMTFTTQPNPNLASWPDIMQAEVEYAPPSNTYFTLAIGQFVSPPTASGGTVDGRPSTGLGASYYRIENALEAIQSPGHWALDSSQGTVYWCYPGADDPNAHSVVAPSTRTAIMMIGNEAKQNFVHHVNLQGLTFEYFDRRRADEGTSPTGWLGFHHGVSPTDAAVLLWSVSDVSIQDCTISKIGDTGIHAMRYAQNVLVSGNDIHDVGGAGVEFAGYGPRNLGTPFVNVNNTISDNRIHDVGQTYLVANGINILDSENLTISGNTVYGTGKDCIQGHGFFWQQFTNICSNTYPFDPLCSIPPPPGGWNPDSTKPYLPGNVRITNNVVHDCMSVFDDGGGIYYGGTHGVLVSSNTIYNSNRLRSSGLYFDKDVNGSTATYNVIFEAPRIAGQSAQGAVHLNHNGRNLVQYNIFALSDRLYRTDDPDGMTEISKNIFLYNPGIRFSPTGPYDPNGSYVIGGSTMDYNLYWTNGKMSELKNNLAAWQAMGWDLHSTVADPLFVDTNVYNFNFKPGSPAFNFIVPGPAGTPVPAAVGSTSITWTWEPAMAAASYEVSLATDTGDIFATVPSNVYLQAGLTPNTTYSIAVAGADNAGVGAQSSTAAAARTFAAAPGVPAAPFSQVSSAALTVSWSSGTPGAGYNPISTLYTVQLSTNASFFPIAGSSQTAGLSASFSGLTASTPYFARAKAANADGVDTAFVALGSTLTPLGKDTVPPSVSIAVPGPGSLLSGTTVLLAFASDDVGVSSVQFRLDGKNLGSAILTPPYAYTWDTTSTPNGGHVLKAFAWDTAGNLSTSAALGVSVGNGWPTPPLKYDAVTDRNFRAKPALPPSGPGSGSWPLNAIYIDPAFGSRMVRVTNSSTTVGTSNAYLNYHFRAPNWEASAWNTDGTLLVVSQADSGISVPFTFDPATMKTARLPDPNSPYGGLVITDDKPVFSRLNPNLLYMRGFNNKGHTTIQQYDFSTGAASNLLDVIAVTPPSPPIGGRFDELTVSAGGGEAIAMNYGGDPSFDSDFYVLYFNKATGAVHLLNTRDSLLDGQPIPPLGWLIHNSRVDQSGRYIVINSAGGANGIVLWDVPAGKIYPLPTPDGGHRVAGFGVLVNYDRQPGDRGPQWLLRSLDPVGINNPINLQPTSNQKPDFEALYNNYETWTNARTDLAAPVVIATYHQPGPDPQRALGDELLAIGSDGKKKVWRFGFHRMNSDSGTFEDSPVLSVSPDGRYALFTSNWEDLLGQDGSGAYRQDAFIVELSSAVSDRTPPTVAISSPTDGAQALATVALQAAASDDVGVAGLQFKLDGADLGAPISAPPYAMNWNTLNASNGAHALTAVAWDGAGNASTSVPVNVTVVNAAWDPNIPAVTPDGFSVNVVNSGNFPGVSVGSLGHPPQFAWSSIERSRGNFSWNVFDQHVQNAQKMGVPILLNLAMTPGWAVSDQSSCSLNGSYVECTDPPDNYRDWDDFITAMATHYKGKVKYYEIWNEFNTTNYWTGKPEDLVHLSSDAYSIIKAVDPNALVVTPSVNGSVNKNLQKDGYTEMSKFLNAGGWKYADIGSFHGYIANDGVRPYPMPEQDNTGPQCDYSQGTCRGSIITKVTVMRQLFDQNNMAGKPMFQTEGSWQDNGNVADADRPAWLARWYIHQLSRTGVVSHSDWWSWSASTAGWGSLQADTDTFSSPLNASGIAYDQVYDWLVGAQFDGGCSPDAQSTWSCVLTRQSPSGYQAAIVWNSSGTLIHFLPAAGFTEYRDLAGNVHPYSGGTVDVSTTPYLFETGNPHTLSVTTPGPGVALAGKALINVNASDPVTLYDGAVQLAVLNKPPYSYVWDTTTAGEGVHTLSAQTAYGSASVPVTVDNTAPSVSLTYPTGGSVSGFVNVAAAASDNAGLDWVEFFLDSVGNGTGIGASTGSYGSYWNTATASPGSHTIYVQAKDIAGNKKNATVAVTVLANITALPFSDVFLTSFTANWTSNFPPGTRYIAEISTGPLPNRFQGNKSSDTANGFAAFKGLMSDHVYYARVSTDAATGPFTPLGTVSLGAQTDLVPPSVAIAAPQNGAKLAGLVLVSGTAFDDVLVSSVQLSLDGGPWAVTWGSTAAWTYALDTTELADGAHTVAARAVDSSGNQATANINFSVVNSSGFIPSTFFGLIIHQLYDTPPQTPIGTYRSWDDHTAWPSLQPSSGVFNWAGLDAWLSTAAAMGVSDVLYTMMRTPTWASSDPNDWACNYNGNKGKGDGQGPGQCHPPLDLNADGTGPNQIWIDYVSSVAARVNDPNYLKTHAHVKYWGVWDEIYRSSTIAPGYNGDFSWQGTYPQLIRLFEDARCVITGRGSVNGVPCAQTGDPGPFDPSAKILSAAGAPAGNQDPYGTEIMRNFLYCDSVILQQKGISCTTGRRGADAVDVIDLEMYIPKEPFETYYPQAIGALRSFLQPTELAKPLFSSEGSWNQTSGIFADFDEQASYVARYFTLAWSTGTGHIVWYGYDDGLTGQLYTPAGGLNGGGKAWQQVYQWMVGAAMTTPCASTGTVWTCGYTRPGGYQALEIWDADAKYLCGGGVCPTHAVGVAPLYLQYRTLAGGAPIQIQNNSVPIGSKPLLLEYAPGMNQPPTVAIAAPAAGIVMGGTVTVSGTASDDQGVVAVDVALDSGAFSPAAGTAAWTFVFDSRLLSNGPHTITARARDASGSAATASLPLTVDNGGVVYPPDAGVINVKDWGARGDGVTDDTLAIQSAISRHLTTTSDEHIFYFPNGVYLLSDTLLPVDSSGTYLAYMGLQGESQANAVLRLKDGMPAFSSARPVVTTASMPEKQNPPGAGGSAFMNNVLDLTIDVGRGNPGAVALDYHANNQGRVDHVTLKSEDGQGKSGLAMTQDYIGPCLIKNLAVSGFDYGVYVTGRGASATFEHVSLAGQNVAGLSNIDNIVSIRDLSSANSVPAVQNSGKALFTLIQANLTGGSPATSAVINAKGAAMYARQIASAGYKSAISSDTTIVPGASAGEWVSHPPLGLYPGASTSSLNLPIQETPDFQDLNLADWASVLKYGADPTGKSDCYAAIQAAIDSGKPVVYLPSGNYKIGQTLVLRGAIRKFLGVAAYLRPTSAFPAGNPAVRADASLTHDVTIERLHFKGFDFQQNGTIINLYSIQDDSPMPLVIKSVRPMTGYRGARGAGPVYIEDTSTGWFDFNGQQVWARQLDPETTQNGYPGEPQLPDAPGVQVTNDGGSLWVLGMKTELISPEIETVNGGKTELLGALFSPHEMPYVPGNIFSSTAGFISENSQTSLVYAFSTVNDYEVQVQESRGGATRRLFGAETTYCSSCTPRAYPRPANGSMAPLFVGYGADAPPTVAISTPSDGAVVRSTITVSGTASDDVGVALVEVAVDSGAFNAASGTTTWTSALDTAALPDGPHGLKARASDAAGNVSISSLTIIVDNTKPVVSSAAVSNVAFTSATVTWLTNEPATSRVEYGTTTAYGSLSPLDQTLVTSHTIVLVNLSTSTTYHLRARSHDHAGNLGVSGDLILTTLTPDLVPPAVAITSPTNGALVSGTLAVSATAADNVAIAYVQFKLDGADIGLADSSAPYSLSWDTTKAANGGHVLTAVAADASGNVSTSAPVAVTVDNAPPVISSVTALKIGQSSATIAWSTDEPADSQVDYGTNTAYGASSPLNLALVTSHSQVLVNLSSSTVYHYRVRSRDAAGNLAVSGDFNFKTLAAPDLTPPAVAIVSPSSGAYVSGTVAVNAAATDNVGVSSVQFKLDGAALGAVDPSAPYGVGWDTTKTAGGTHTLTAVAWDFAGNASTSAPVMVVVDNAAPAISSVAASGIGANTATVTWNTDENADSQVEYGLSVSYGLMTPLDPTFTKSHRVGLTELLPSTLYHYRVRSRDAAGNLALSGDYVFRTSAGSVIGPKAAPGLRDAYVYPNPAIRRPPTIRAVLGVVDAVELTIFDAGGRPVHGATLPNQPSGILPGGDYYYDYVWSGTIASGSYYAVIHGKRTDGTVVRARVNFAVVR